MQHQHKRSPYRNWIPGVISAALALASAFGWYTTKVIENTQWVAKTENSISDLSKHVESLDTRMSKMEEKCSVIPTYPPPHKYGLSASNYPDGEPFDGVR